MEVLSALLYDRVNGGFSRPDMERIFIALGGNTWGVGGVVGLGVGGGGSDLF